MRKSLFLLSFLFVSSILLAQAPANDECSNAIDLGVAPTCPNSTVYSNIDATASVLPSENTPVCFSTVPDRDVWFTFSVPNDGSIVDFTLQLLSSVDNGVGIQNPQIAIYRIDGSCDELAELDCISAEDGSAALSFDLVGLTPGETYYLRVNEYSASATPNAGEFTLCVSEFVPFFNLCESTSTNSCFGTLYDSGGPDGDYQAGEACTFTICPSDFNACIGIDLIDYNIEAGFDNLIFYAGDETSDPVISTISGGGNGNPFEIETDSDCITIQFTTDGSGQQEGFELTWQCSPNECNSSLDDITVINGLPYDVDDLTTCDNSATFQGTSCGVLPFLAGPEAVFTYTSDGSDDACYGIQVSGASAGTGIAVLNGPPTDPGSTCLATSGSGNIGSVSFAEAGTYYIVVANGDGCTDFDISIQETTCVIDPSLESALCNPLNGCQNEDGVPAIFNFSTDFFVDVPIVNNVNDGCWGGVGAGNFYWFTIQAAADGPFGFTFQAADLAEASDIDFSVWGPYTNEQVCGNPQEVIDAISSTQPLASSWAGGTEPTGLAEIHPTTGTVQDELYDCEGVGASNNDDFVDAIDCTTGEVYVVLVNDWGGNILSGVVQVDFSASGDGVLDPLDQLVAIDVEAAEVCQGTPVQLGIETESENITWEPAETLSCSDCPNPIATPTETTEYTVIIDGVCIDAIGTATVNVYDANAGPDQTVCLNEQIQIVAGQEYENGVYSWTGAPGTLSCDDCAAPVITGLNPGVFTYSVTLTAPGCTITDEMTLTVFPQEAAQYQVSPALDICAGETVNIGGMEFPNTTYAWASVPLGFVSMESNPAVSPTETTTYYLTATNTSSGCLFPSLDSVLVTVSQPFILDVEPDISVCQGDEVVLSTLEPEEDVVYSWSPITGLNGDPSVPNISATPTATTTYTLTATRGACEESLSITIEVNEISINIQSPSADTGICIGESVEITATAQPTGIEVNWTPAAGLSATTGLQLTATPTDPTLYIATVEVPGCVRMDSLFIDVDSLPSDMNIMPQDTTVCENSVIILSSPVFDPADYPGITHQWSPTTGFQTPDSLYNAVIAASETETYIRTTINGFCEQVDEVTVNVQEVNSLIVTPSNPEVCPGETIEFTVTSTDPEITSFTWMPNNVVLSCDDCPNPSATINTPGTYSISVEGDTDLECPPTASVTITVLDIPNAPSGDALCEPGIISLNNGGSNNPDYTYQWSSEDGSFTSTDPNPTFNLQVTTTFNYTISSGSCPPVSGTITFSIAEEESVTITGDLITCAGDATVLTAETSSSGGSFEWSPTGETSSSIDVLSTGLYVVTYVPNPNCPDISFMDEVNVEVFEFPTSDSITQIDNCIFEGQELTLSVATIDTDVSFEWTDASGVIGSTQSITVNAPALFDDPMVEDSTDYTYTVTLTNAGGCSISVSTDVCIKNSAFQVPNLFTPDNDDVNSTFAPIFGPNLTLTTYEVYNRWGQKVFDGIEDDLDEWDGNFNDKPAPADVYVVIIKYVDGLGAEEVYKGDLTLIR